jgi:hypothetical protein
MTPFSRGVSAMAFSYREAGILFFKRL